MLYAWGSPDMLGLSCWAVNMLCLVIRGPATLALVVSHIMLHGHLIALGAAPWKECISQNNILLLLA
jgi:hypothetical protein